MRPGADLSPSAAPPSAQETTVGKKNLAILAAQRVRRGSSCCCCCYRCPSLPTFSPLFLPPPQDAPIYIYDFEGKAVFVCTANFYGIADEHCLPCPQGAKCPGGELASDLVTVGDGGEGS